MTKISDIKWGKYKNYEGPVYYGSVKYKLPSNPSSDDKLLAVTTATEGGTLDAVQSYDSGIISVGLIQLIEASYFLASKLIGYTISNEPGLIKPLQPALDASDTIFKNNGRRWRFFVRGDEVDELPEQRRLFLLNSNGYIGSWDDESKKHSKLWIASMSDFLAQDQAVKLQTTYVASRLRSFVMPKVKPFLWDGKPDDTWVGATRAAYVSFSANNPLRASQSLDKAIADSSAYSKWSKDWCINIIKWLTFGSGITIYPHRYNKIRPVIERIYNVDLPDFAEELKSLDLGGQGMWDPREIQQALSDLGYDIGPSGVDGKWGPKSTEAMLDFQRKHGIVSETLGYPDKKTRAVLIIMRDEQLREPTIDQLASYAQGLGIDLARDEMWNE